MPYMPEQAAKSLPSGQCRLPSESRESGQRRLVSLLWTSALIGLAGTALVRAALFLVYCGYTVSSPVQAYHLEGVNVHFAWRFQEGLRLYPDPHDGPACIVNFVGPLYFMTVGTIGRVFDADVATLYTVGRCVSVSCSLAVALLIAAYLHVRHGELAAFVGGAMALGAAPMIGFGVMARPDMMADFLGAAGFFLCCRRSRRSGIAGILCLILSILTKQTAAIYLAAAVVVLFCEGRRRRSVTIALTSCGSVLGALLVLSAAGEPAVFEQFLGQAGIPFAQFQWMLLTDRLLERSPELLYFPLLGCWFGLGAGAEEDRRFCILTAVLLIGSTICSAKLGSDLNYYLQLRILAAIAAGAACRSALCPNATQWKGIVAVLFGVALCGPSLLGVVQAAREAHRLSHGPTDTHSIASSVRYRAYDPLYLEWAADPRVSLLTDFDQIAAHQAERAAFLDAYLLRLRVANRNADLSPLVHRVKAHDYDWIILTANIDQPSYRYAFWRLPSGLADAIRHHYRLAERRGGFFAYVPDTETAGAAAEQPDNGRPTRSDKSVR